jgi:hypothetical protein
VRAVATFVPGRSRCRAGDDAAGSTTLHANVIEASLSTQTSP